MYFEYISRAHEVCGTRLTRECSELVMKNLQIDQEIVEKCVLDTFEGGDPSVDDNSVLRESAALWNEYGTFLYPAIVINDMTFRGRLNPENVYEAVCASFRHEPKECRAWQMQEGIPIPKG